MPVLARALVLLAVSASAAPAGWTAPPARAGLVRQAEGGAGARPSLEEVLEGVRARREKARARLVPAIGDLVRALNGLPPEATDEELEPLRADLRALPPEAAHLLVPWLDPGAAPTPSAERRAAEVLAVLRDSDPSAITGELLELARTGTPAGASHATGLLARAEPGRAGRALRSLWASLAATPERAELLAADVLGALAAVGGTENHALVVQALASESEARIAAALTALARAGTPEARATVRDFLDTSPHALRHLPAVLAYYRARPDHLGDDDAALLVRRLGHPDASDALRRTALDFLGDRFAGARPGWVEALRALPSARYGDGRVDVLVCLARLGDRGAKRDLLDDADQVVEANERSVAAWIARGALLVRLGEYGDAIRDYRTAFELARPFARQQEVGLELARAYVLHGKVRQSASVLEDLSLSHVQKRDLREDPDFAALVEHPRHGRVLD